MRWHLLLAVIGLSMTGVSCWSQDSLSAERLGQLTSGVVHFQMVQGRIVLDAPRHRKGSQSIDHPDHFESIRVTASRGIPSLHYVCRTPSHHLSIHVAGANNLAMESFIPKSGTRCEISQPARGPIRCSITQADQTQTIVGSTLIDLRLQNDSLFDEHFGFVISRMLKGTSLEEFSQRVLSEVVQAASTSQSIDREVIIESIEDLRHRKQSVRAAAERRLVRSGISIVPMVESHLESNSVDPEQRMRLERLLARLQPQRPDDARSLARRLVNDRSYWTSVASKLSQQDRIVATEHLQRQDIRVDALSGAPILGEPQPVVSIAEASSPSLR